MATTTTTWGAIRDRQIAVIEALTPRRIQSSRFQVERAVTDFRLWAANYPAACFRRFSVAFEGQTGQNVTNESTDLLRARGLLLVAYPAELLGLYGPGGPAANLYELHDVAEEDFNQISRAIGVRGTANYVSAPDTGQIACLAETATVVGSGPVLMMQVPLDVTYYRGVSP